MIAIIQGDWKGVGEDPYRANTFGDWPKEHEITLLKNTHVPVSSVKVRHPQTRQWTELMDKTKPPVPRMAVRRRGGILSHSEMRR